MTNYRKESSVRNSGWGDRSSLVRLLRSVQLSFVVCCLAIASLTSVAVALQAQTAEAATPEMWSVVPSPGTDLTAVSCASSSFCMALGAGGSSAETWNGSAWSTVSAPDADSVAQSAGTLSCTSSTFCVSVGSDDDSQTLAEEWNGTSWSVMATPNPDNPGDDQSATLKGVSCTSSTFCVAVGDGGSAQGNYSYTYATLVESWNGSAWSIVSSEDPSSFESGVAYDNDDPIKDELNGVSCTNSDYCVAVGDYNTIEDPGGQDEYFPTYTLVESGGAGGFSVTSSPSPAGGSPYSSDTLSNLGCYGSTNCVATGYCGCDSFSTIPPLDESWNGSAWSVIPPEDLSSFDQSTSLGHRKRSVLHQRNELLCGRHPKRVGCDRILERQ